LPASHITVSVNHRLRPLNKNLWKICKFVKFDPE
jgi:hypothetical protein